MHPDNARDHGAPREVHRPRARRHPNAGRRADVSDLAILDDDGLARLRRRTRAVNDRDVRERDNRLAHAHVLLSHLLCELGRRLAGYGQERRNQQDGNR